MPSLQYWSIIVEIERSIGGLELQQMRDELWLGPNLRLAGMTGMAHIETEELAQQFLDACLPIFNKRYKDGYTVRLVPNGGHDHKSLRGRIDRDSTIIRIRLATGNFAPNKPVV